MTQIEPPSGAGNGWLEQDLLSGALLAATPRQFLKRFDELARTAPEATALSLWGTADGTLSYGALHSAAASTASGLIDRGLTKRPVILSLPSGAAFVSAFIGCLMAGAYAVPVPTPRMPVHKARFTAILKALGVETPIIGETSDSGLCCLDPDALHGPAQTIPSPSDDDIAFLQFSSGSTGQPRGIAVSHANLAANIVQIEQIFCAGAARRSVTWLPHFHDMGLIGGILIALARGYEVVQIAPERFLRSPADWLRAIAAGGPTISGGPTFGYFHSQRRIRDGAVDELDLSNWEVAFCGAEPIRPQVLDAFEQRFSAQGFRSAAFLPCYGLAEATLLVSAGSWRGSGQRDAVAVGTPTRGTRIRLCAHPDAPDGTGEICIAGPQVTKAHWSPGSKRIETSTSGDAAEHWLATGDAGYLRNGELVVVDRLKDIIILDGTNIAAAEVEAAAMAEAPGGVAAFGAGTPERLCVIVELPSAMLRDGRDQAVVEALSRRIWTELGFTATVLTIPAGRLPRTSSGKIQRHAARSAYLRGDFERTREPAEK